MSSDSGHSSPMSAAGHSPICHTRGATAAGSRDTISAVNPGGSREESADLDASSQANTSLDASGKFVIHHYFMTDLLIFFRISVDNF